MHKTHSAICFILLHSEAAECPNTFCLFCSDLWPLLEHLDITVQSIWLSY